MPISGMNVFNDLLRCAHAPFVNLSLSAMND
jgi:hypothetical protein